MKKLLTIIGALLFLSVAALILIPAFMNWSSYKGMIASHLKDMTQLDVLIEGKVKLRLLPTPALAVQKVRIKAPQGCREGDFLALEALEAHLGLSSLLQGKIDLSSIALIHPQLDIDVADTCKYPFKTESLTPTTTGPSVKISALTIDEGTVSLYEGTHQNFSIKDLSFKASFDDLTGPYHLSGEGTYQGQDLTVDIDMGQLSLKNTPLKVRGAIGDDHVNFEGVADLMPGTPRLQGKIKADLMNKDGLFKKLRTDLPQNLQKEITVESDVTVTREAVTANALTFNWHKLHGEGQLTSTFEKIPTITGDLKFDPFLLDDYLKKARQETKTAFIFKKAYAEEPRDTTLPKSFILKLNLLAESITFQQALLTHTKGTINIENGLFSVKNIHMGLPLDGKLTGEVAFTPIWGYSGQMKCELPQLLPYLTANNIQPPKGLMQTLSLSTRFKGDGQAFNFDKLNAKLDDTVVTGAGLLRLSDFGLAGKFHFNALDLDTYLQIAALGQDPKLYTAASKPSHLPPLNIQASCDVLKIKDHDLLNVQTNFILEDDQLAFSNFSAKKEDLTFEASGKAKNLSKDMTIDINAAAKGQLQDVGDVKGTVNCKGPLTQLETVGSFFIYGANGQFEGSFNLLDPTENIQGLLKVTHPEAGFLFGDRDGMGAFAFETKLVTHDKVLSLTKLTGAIGRNRLSGNASIDFTQDRPFVVANLDLGNMKLAEAPSLTPRVIRIAQITPEKPFSKEPFNMHFWNAFDGKLNFTAKEFAFENVPFSNLTLKANLNNGHLQSERISADLFGGHLEGSLGFVLRGTPQLTGSFQLQQMDLKSAQDFFGAATKFTGLLDAEFVMQGRGASPYDLMSSVTGQANLNVNQAVIHGLDLNALKRKLDAFDTIVDIISLLGTIKEGGTTPLYKAAGTFIIQQGQATTDNTTITCEAGAGQMRGTLFLPEKSMDMQAEFNLKSTKEFPALNARFYGPWNAPHTDFDTAKLQAFIIGSGALKLPVTPEAKKETKKKALKNLLEEILPEENPQPQEKFDGKELVTDLLQGLIK